MKIKVAQVVGLNTDQKAAQVTSFVRDSDNAFLAVLLLSCDDAFTKGRQALSELGDYYFDAEGSAADKLKATFEQVAKKLPVEASLGVVLAALSGKVLYLIGDGEVEVYLKRLGKLSPLLSVGASKQLISGFVQEGDRLLLSTNSLTSFLGEDLTSSLDLPIDTFEEEISAKVGSADLEEQGLAGLSVEVEADKPTVIPTLSAEDQGQSIPEVPEESQVTGLNILAHFKKFFPRTGRSRLILALILILIISLGAGLQFKNSRDQERQRQFNQAVQSAKDDYHAALGLASLNPVEAKSKLEAAKNKVDQALTLQPKDQEAENLRKQIEDNANSILQQFVAQSIPLFLDVDLVKKDFQAQHLSLSAGRLLLLDPNSKTLVVLDVAKKSHQILAGSDKLGDAALASVNGGLAFVYAKDKGLLRVDILNQKPTTVSKKDAEWGDILDVTGFASNVYLLDTSNPSTGSGQIWKYLPTSAGYSDKREYLNKGVKVDFAGGLRMQIESSVYVLKRGGEIFRFTRGDKDHFGLEGLDKGIKDPKSFFVSSETDNLYLLDSGNSRLLVLTKTGAYKSQYQGDKFAQATDLVVDEKGKKVYLLEGSKIYQMDLK